MVSINTSEFNNKLRLEILQSHAYKQYINSLRTNKTKDVYATCFHDFVKFLGPTCDTLLSMEPKQIQQSVIDYVIDMRDNRRLSPNTISLRVSALQTFFLINDIEGMNWPKIKRFKGEFYTVADDRPYTRQEISKLVNSAISLRDKAIILLLSSSGLRVGGLVKLQLKHMKAIDNYHIYQFAVYKSSRDAYITFCTPEARNAIDEYLSFRERLGEKLTSDSPLFRMEFETQFGARAPAKPITLEGTYAMISKLRHKSGIIQKQH